MPCFFQEIVLIDDGSDASWLRGDSPEGLKFENFIQSLPKVTLKRIERSGLMVARTQGALAATGETLTFLDSHIEVRCFIFVIHPLPYKHELYFWFYW